MDIGVIAKRYAKALLEYAMQQQCEDRVYDEMRQVIAAYRSTPQIAHVLSDPFQPVEQKESVICRAASDAASDVLRRFAALVVEHKRESLMLFIAHSYVSIYRKQKHISLGRLVTAVPASAEVAKRLEGLVKKASADAEDVIIEQNVDPAILGGFIFQIDDQRLDASVRTQFETIKKQFIEKNKRII